MFIIIIFSWFLYAGSIASAISFFQEDEIFPYNNGEWTSGIVLLPYVHLMMYIPFAFSCCCLQRHHREVPKTYRDDAQREINTVLHDQALVPKDFVIVMIGADAFLFLSSCCLLAFDSNDDVNNRSTPFLLFFTSVCGLAASFAIMKRLHIGCQGNG